MYSSQLENKLIIVDIVDTLQDYTSIQLDIDPTKVKAASIAAQKADVARIIGTVNEQRCIDPQTPADENLKQLVIPALCYYTYARCLKMFQGTFTDSGYTTETEADDRNSAKSVSNEMNSLGDVYMKDVITFLEAESPGTEQERTDKLVPRIRVFGGKEHRGGYTFNQGFERN
jgi:hypothetical protein